jgi:DNA-binding transcriptional regulator YdaS (Cro superfamily)
VEIARAAWEPFGGCPDWITIMAEECDRTSQRAVAGRIGYSAGAVNQVLSAKYKAPTDKIEQAVRGAYLCAVVACPVLGELAADQCLEHQKHPWSSSPLRLRLYKACRAGCPHSRITPNAAKENAT